VLHHAHDVGAPDQRSAGITAGNHLGQRGQIGRNAVEALRAAGRAAESADHLVEDEHDAVFGGDVAQIGQELRGSGTWPKVAPVGSTMMAAMSSRCSQIVFTASMSLADREPSVDDALQDAWRRRAVAEGNVVVPAVKWEEKRRMAGLPV